jgi:DNA-binding NarL/FixJ family response regulator
LLKDRVSEVKEFIAALRRVADGGSALDPTIVSTMLKRHRSSDPLDSLTPREREVLELMATGASNAGIAESMVITQRAAEKYVSTIFTKLGIPTTGSESRRVLAVLLSSVLIANSQLVATPQSVPTTSAHPCLWRVRAYGG